MDKNTAIVQAIDRLMTEYRNEPDYTKATAINGWINSLILQLTLEPSGGN